MIKEIVSNTSFFPASKIDQSLHLACSETTLEVPLALHFRSRFVLMISHAQASTFCGLISGILVLIVFFSGSHSLGHCQTTVGELLNKLDRPRRRADGSVEVSVGDVELVGDGQAAQQVSVVSTSK